VKEKKANRDRGSIKGVGLHGLPKFGLLLINIRLKRPMHFWWFNGLPANKFRYMPTLLYTDVMTIKFLIKFKHTIISPL